MGGNMSGPTSGARPRRVVVVDDDAVVTNLVVEILRGAGYEPEGTSSAEDALRIISERPPELVITDVQMGAIDGFDLCTMLRDHPQTGQTKVIFLSAVAGEFEHGFGRLVGGAAYIDKPFSPQILLATVRSVVDEIVSVT